MLHHAKLKTNEESTSGWTMIGLDGRPCAYVREVSPMKVEPGRQWNTLVLIEKGAMACIVCPYEVDKCEYLETHEVEVSFNSEQESKVIGCKCKLYGLSLKSSKETLDNRQITLVFEKGDKDYTVVLTQKGEVLVSE